jgi:glycosyltransferase involved in cell wall biosynthesis
VKLSIVTICRNNAPGLARTLRSTFANQTGFPDWEQLVVDGASTDGSFAEVDRYRGDPRLGWCVSEPDAGIYDAMDKGAAHARGEHLLFLNAGDELLPDVLSRVFAEPPGADIVYGDMFAGLGPGARLRTFPEGGDLSPVHFLVGYLPHPSSFVSRALFERLGGYDRRFRIAGDHDFFLRAVAAPETRFRHLPFPVARMEPGGISTTLSSWPEMRREMDAALAPFFPEGLRRRVLDGIYCRRVEPRSGPEDWAVRRSPADGCLRPSLRARLDADPASRRRALRFLDLFSALDRARPGRALLGFLASAAERLEARRLRRR